MWWISLQSTRNVIDKSTRSAVRQFDWPLTRRVFIHYKMLGKHSLNATSYTDTLISSVKSAGSDTCAQVFVTDFDNVAVYPM